MDIEGQEESSNVEDRRGTGGGSGFGNLGGRLALGGGGIGGIIVVIIALALGVNPQQFLTPGGGAPSAPQDPKLDHFVKVIFHDTEIVWDEQFKKMGKTYPKPTLVLFSGATDTDGCGSADAAVGPFYCPADKKVYIDLSFYRELETKLNAPGDFAKAYVIAHEVGHHVQGLLFPDDVRRVEQARRRPGEANQMSVRLELQADYLAGVWAHYGQEKFHFLQAGDLDSALKAAYEIGDDRLQRKAGRNVDPYRFTHGTSAQRQRWFKKGFDTGNVMGARALFTTDYNDL